MSAFDNNPLTTRLQGNFTFKFSLMRAPSLSYFAQNFELPGITNKSADESNPFLTIPHSGDHMAYDPLNLSFIVDAKLQNWLEIHNWMRGITSADGNTAIYSTLENNLETTGYNIYSELNGFVMDSQNNPVYVIVFHRAFPTRLSSLKFSSTNSEATYITADVEFKFVNYDIQIP